MGAFSGSDLTPATFDHDPTVVAMNPVMGDPTRAGMGWTVPAAGDPDVACAIPALITVNPYEAALRRWRAALDDGGGRANANHNLRK